MPSDSIGCRWSTGCHSDSGIKRGLFSNEAGEGSAPNAAAVATVSHPVKQGLIQCWVSSRIPW